MLLILDSGRVFVIPWVKTHQSNGRRPVVVNLI